MARDEIKPDPYFAASLLALAERGSRWAEYGEEARQAMFCAEVMESLKAQYEVDFIRPINEAAFWLRSVRN